MLANILLVLIYIIISLVIPYFLYHCGRQDLGRRTLVLAITEWALVDIFISIYTGSWHTLIGSQPVWFSIAALLPVFVSAAALLVGFEKYSKETIKALG